MKFRAAGAKMNPCLVLGTQLVQHICLRWSRADTSTAWCYVTRMFLEGVSEFVVEHSNAVGVFGWLVG